MSEQRRWQGDPAKTVICYFGGASKLARILGCSRQRLYYWTWPFEKGGSGGLVPARIQSFLLAYAQAKKIDLRPADFFNSERLRAKLQRPAGGRKTAGRQRAKNECARVV